MIVTSIKSVRRNALTTENQPNKTGWKYIPSSKDTPEAFRRRMAERLKAKKKEAKNAGE